MRRRKLVVALTGLAVVIMAGVVAPRLQLPSRVTRENLTRIRLAMSQAEVEQILGGPPGDYSTGPTQSFHEHWRYTGVFLNDGKMQEGWDPFWGQNEWRADDVSLLVYLDDSMKVMAVRAVRNELVEQSWADNLLWRAKRQWHCWFPSSESAMRRRKLLGAMAVLAAGAVVLWP